jgi:hypothetical protein
VPLTVADVAAHLNAPVPAEGDGRRVEMQRALDTAVQELERMTGRLQDRTATALVSSPGSTLVTLPYVQLTAVGPIRDPYGQTVDPVYTDLLAGVVVVSAPSFGTWRVDCTGGPWPAALESAALDWAAHVYDTQRTTLNPTADEDTALPSFALPNRVAQFAAPYLLPGMA